MARGPKIIPAEIKEVTGNPGRRPVAEPKKDGRAVGQPYVGMTDTAKEVWFETADEYSLVLSYSDRKALRMFCEAWAEMLYAREKVDEEGSMIRTPNGMIQKSPWLSMYEQRKEFVRKMLAEFGGSPAARQKVAQLEKEDDDNDFFNRKRSN